ncbi:MAG: YggS family pyridoxal phosphate-dependent enzyme [Clostridia bacterium]|nr:YggS family pyridoxal phosphate-dependent enzyme [Clostridia bacterium]
MEYDALRENARRLLDEVGRLAKESGHEVTLLAASKTRNKEEIRAVLSAGIGLFGENKADELCRKYAEGAYEGARLDFIGTLQSNKAKLLVGKVDLIHSLASESALLALEKEAAKRGIRQKVLIEIHVGNEETKSGVPLAGAEAFAARTAALPHLDLRGLMTVPPVGEDPAPYFERVAALYEKLKPVYALDTLSMGMTHDYEKAIRAGATLVRIGTALFGERDYSR